MEETDLSALSKLSGLLLPWYDKNKRDLPWRENTDPYRVLVSEIMLQQTRVEAARAHYVRFLDALPDVQALADCPEDRLLKLWEGLGYYSRARNLQRAAKIIAKEGFPRAAKELEKLPGVGKYTAGAVASIAFGQPAPAVDGNVVRVLARVLADGREQAILRREYFGALAPAYPPARCGDFTQSLMELGATVCLPASPRCADCPLFSLCKTKSDALPRPEEKAARKKSEVGVFVFLDGETLFLCRRREGVLRGTYAFFCADGSTDEESARALLRGAHLSDFSLKKAGTHRHVFTHLEWEMTAFLVQTKEDVSRLTARPKGAHGDFCDLKLFSLAQAKAELSVPSAFRWVFALLPEQA